MKVKDVMSKQVVTADPDATIRDVAKLMSEVDTGIIPIFNDEGLGVVTDRDIVIRAVAEGLDAEEPVSLIMTTGVESCLEDDDLSEAAYRMSELQMRRLIVFDASGKICGVLSLGDIAVRQEELAGVALEEISDDTTRRT
ncbi:CBS domain-containing protein [Rhizobium cauense]|uniref:CBS domain-containing protein n=1 Tax=Rhizobium cauense TaxID=1166683 RepID=UPI001C6E04E8|nr:CBS domain-containing protein [Rhizobium cauense]MBW9117325.1 CBS domain-containing protein [Rhizobium cauense]